MSTGTTHLPLSLEQLSALADGELHDVSAVGAACSAWHAEPAQRAAWHAYHLIGDVMRSDDLAGGAARDVAFLASLRERLAAEPVVLAPAPLLAGTPVRAAAGARRRFSWIASAAVAAGFVAVGGVLVVVKGADPALAVSAGLASVQPAQPGLQPVVNVAAVPEPGVLPETAAEPRVIVVDGQLIRDAQLDRYLAAHKQFAGSSALGVPSAFLRSATSDAFSR